MAKFNKEVEDAYVVAFGSLMIGNYSDLQNYSGTVKMTPNFNDIKIFKSPQEAQSWLDLLQTNGVGIGKIYKIKLSEIEEKGESKDEKNS